MVRVADRCYGVSLQNKVSSIDILEKETALEFVRELQSEEEALEEGGGMKKAGAGGRKKKEGGDVAWREDQYQQQPQQHEQVEDEEEEEEEGEEGSESDVPSKKKARGVVEREGEKRRKAGAN